MIKKFYILLIVMVSGVALLAQPTILFNPAVEDELVAGQMQVYNDPTGTANFATVSKLHHLFAANTTVVPQYLSTPSAIWLKANIRVEIDEHAMMCFYYPMIDTLELYVVGANGKIIDHRLAGAFVPIHQRVLKSNTIKFKLHKGLYTYYIRAKGTYSLQLPIKLQLYETVYKKDTQEFFFQGSYLGVVLLIFICVFFLWLKLKEKVYIFYSLHILTTALRVLYLGGFAYLFFWPNTYLINNYEPAILSLGTLAVVFTMFFLETAHRQKKTHKWLVVLIIAGGFACVVDLMGFHKTANQFIQIVGIVSGISILVAGSIALIKGYKPARLFLIGWAIFLISVLVSILVRVAILPYNFYFAHALQIGSAVEMILLLFALIDRINSIQKQSIENKEQYYTKIAENEEHVRQQNALLSLKVEERSREMREQTEMLEAQKKELEELNTTKDKIFSVIAHDLRGPLGNVSQLANMMAADEKLRNEETLELLKDASKRSFDLLDSLLHWAKAQFGDGEYQPSKVNFYAFTDETIKLYSLKAKAKEIAIENKVPPTLYANGDANMINTVIRNLISNALKFTIVGGKIVIGGDEDNENQTVSLWVKDSGLGIAEDKVATIFEAGKNKSVKGTDGEIGTGLGLVICKDFVEKNNGTIKVKSVFGKGSTFTITLPQYNQ